jgi:hypothetical protein
MHVSFNLLRIEGLYMFRALLAHPQEALHKRNLVYCVRIVSVGCGTVADYTHALYRTIILPVVLYGCETWSLTLRQERRLRVFENRVLRRIFGPKRDEARGVEKTS